MLRRLLALGLAALMIGCGAPAAAGGGRAPRAEAVQLAPQRPGVVDAYILSFGLWGPQSVFESEAKGAARALEAALDSPGRSIVRFNGKRRFGARPRDLMAAADAVGRVLDPEEDVVVLVLSSHGSPEGVAIVAGAEQRIVSPDVARVLLDRTRARHRVLIVSACYSGVFARALADPRTLVVTAAAPDRPSFGCRDGATWTYFGDAFFNQALRSEPDLAAAFARARALVTAREQKEGFEPSNPQIAGGAEVLGRLGARRPRGERTGTSAADVP
ncbi:MAG TPA: C13 family peptidase [Microvirga sp.]|jgi:hypothetical protein|nr:C13 family peptidase [Microvirga sp.]